MNSPYQKHLKTKLGYSLLFFIFLFYTINVNADDYLERNVSRNNLKLFAQNHQNTNYRNYFKEEIEGISNFEVLKSTYAHFNPIGGFADGNYKLKNYRVVKLDYDIYRLDLVFRKKKGMFRFYERVSYVFFYDGNIIAFKTQNGKYKYRLTNIKTLKNKKIKYQSVNVVLPAQQRGKVYLKMRIYINPADFKD